MKVRVNMTNYGNEYFGNTVLFVDDEIEILKLLNRNLKEEAYKKFFAQSAKESLDIIDKYQIDVLVTDIIIPGTNGLELMKMIQDKYPEIIRVVISSHTQPNLVLATINKLGVFKYISKPWDVDQDLKPAIREALNHYNSNKRKKLFRYSLTSQNAVSQELLKQRDESITHIKDDMDLLKQLQHNINYYVDMLVEQVGNEELEYDLFHEERKFVEEKMDQYMNIFPMEIREIHLEKLGVEFNKIILDCLQRHSKGVLRLDEPNSVNYVMENEPRYVFHGEYKLLMLCFKVIFESLFQAFHHNVFTVVLKEVSQQENKLHRLRLTITEDFTWFTESELRLKSSLMFLDLWLTQFSGTLMIEEYEDKKMIAIEVQLSKLRELEQEVEDDG